jgi:hypothetical protein
MDWGRQYNIAEGGPLYYMGLIHSGAVTARDTATMSKYWPRAMQDIKASISTEIAQFKGYLPYQHRRQLGAVFGLPVDSGDLDVAWLQQFSGGTQSARNEQPSMTGVKNLKLKWAQPTAGEVAEGHGQGALT